MAQTVGNHAVATFTAPSNGDTLDATVVKGNDNTLRSSYVDHDADTGIHLQSSTLSSRPAAGTAGRKWLTNDSGSVKLWYDTGSVWEEVSYIPTTGNVTLPGDLAVNGNVTFGDANTDTFSITSRLASSLVPSVTATNDIGTTALRWRDVYATTLTGTLNSSNLTGALPAISGASLTSLTAANLTGTTLPSSIVTSSLTSVGALTALSVAGTSTIQQALEKVTISATAATGTVQFDAATQAILYYTTNASANWTLNIRGNSGTTLTSMMSAGQSITVVFMVTNGATAYYPSAHQIDGSAVTPKWVSGSAASSGNANAIDAYTYTIVKTSGGFTMLASRSFFS